MMAAEDLLGESLKDLCAAHARLFQDLALEARNGERGLLERLRTIDRNAEFQRQRADQAEVDNLRLLHAGHELEQEAIRHHNEMLVLRRQLYTAKQSAWNAQENESTGLFGSRQACAPLCAKKMTLNAFLDIVDQMRMSKAKADAKNQAMGFAHETMEHYMYTFLRERLSNRRTGASFVAFV